MPTFFMRFIGALVLDAATYEAVEADPRSAMQSVLVVLAACAAGGVAALGLDAVSFGAFITGTILSLGAWLMWVSLITTIGTVVMPETRTRSNLPEVLRVLGFAAAPGVFLALAAMRPAAPIVMVIVAAWLIAAAVLGLRQALDYRSTARAVAVCVAGAVLSFLIIGGALMLFSRNVS